MPIRHRHGDIHADRRILIGQSGLVVRRQSGRADHRDRREPQRVFRVGELRRGLLRESLAATSGRSRSACATSDALSVGGASGSGSSVKFVGRHLGRAERRRQAGVRRLHVVSRLDQQQLRLAEIHLREAQVERGLQTALRQRADLIDDDLPRRDGLFRDAEDGLRTQRVEIRAIDPQQHGGPPVPRVLLLRIRPERRGCRRSDVRPKSVTICDAETPYANRSRMIGLFNPPAAIREPFCASAPVKLPTTVGKYADLTWRTTSPAACTAY